MKFAEPTASVPEEAAGVYRLTRDSWFDVMGARPTSALWGVGASTQQALERLGMRTVADLADAPLSVLQKAVGDASARWPKASVGGRTGALRASPRSNRARVRPGGPKGRDSPSGFPALF